MSRTDWPVPGAELALTDDAVLGALRKYLDERGIPPTLAELQELTGLPNVGRIQRALRRLEKRGKVKVYYKVPRGIALLDK